MAKASNYGAESITVLEGLEAVRKRPGMYIGSVSTRGLNHLIYEIVDNAVDEHLAGYCDTITVTLEADGSATVTDNGRGIPVGMHEKGISAERLVFTTLHAGGKFDNSAYKTSGGLHGVGSSVVNALSARMTVTVKVDGFIYEDKYERGIPVIELENGLLPVKGKTRETGTAINFLPDDTIFDKTRFKEDEVKSRLHETAYLNPNLTIVFRDLRRETPEDVTYHEPEGITGFIKDMNRNQEAVHEVIYFSGESEGIAVEAAFQYINEFHENVLGFCNNIYNSEGSFDSQFASFPLESKETCCFVSMFVFARSSLFRIFAAFSAQDMIFFRVSRFLSKKRVISSPVILLTTLEASWLSSFVLVCPSNLGSGCLMEITAVMPFLTSAPVKFTSFSFRISSSLA